MTKKRKIIAVAATGFFLSIAAVFWGMRGPDALVVSVFPASWEAFREIVPAFQRHWKEKTGRRLEVRSSRGESGARSRAVAEGARADVAVFSSSADVLRLERAGLVSPDWRSGKYGGMAFCSIIVLAVREGNPCGIRGWGDLAREDVEVVTPHPKLSGDGRWNFLALYGAADRGAASPYAAGDAGAFRFTSAVFRNISSLEAGARRSFIRFEGGRGDVAVAWESEVLAAKRNGIRCDRLTPRSTVLIEFPAVVVDFYADKRGVREEAEAFLEFLRSEEAQDIFARHGFRPVDQKILARHRRTFPWSSDLWTARDYGGWSDAGSIFFGPGGLFDSVMEEVHAPAL